MIKILISLAAAIGAGLSICLIIFLLDRLNESKESRFKQHVDVSFLSGDIALFCLLYVGAWVLAQVREDFGDIFRYIYIYHIIPSAILFTFLLFKIIYKIYTSSQAKSGKGMSDSNIPKQYYKKEEKVYLYPQYCSVSKSFKYTALAVIASIVIGTGIITFLNIEKSAGIYVALEALAILPVFLWEITSYFDGQIETESEIAADNNEAKAETENMWNELETEYIRLWRKQLLSRYKIQNRFERKVLDDDESVDVVSKSIAQVATKDNSNQFLYSRILSPIMRGDNLIVESCMLQSFSEIIVPIVNIMFTASKRMMFLCDSISTVKQCANWLESINVKSEASKSKIVIDVLNYEDSDTIKIDNNIDIYIGTVDLALNSKAVFENIDVVFCVNIDKIVSESALDLNLLASVLSSDRYETVQYILFGNRVNGLKQTVSKAFMKNDFKYQAVNNAIKKQVDVNFWSAENDWFQSEIFSGSVSQFMGQLIPLAIPPFKYGFNHVNIIASNQPYSDHMQTLQTSQSMLKKYFGLNMVNIDEAVTYSDNENFIRVGDKDGDKAVVVVEDSSNNAALVLLNWLKYSKNNMCLNIISSPYLLRDYIISNIDFFVGNADCIGAILPSPNGNIKLAVYRLLNQLCYGNVAEEALLREINNQELSIKVDTFENDQVRFVTEALQDLTKRAFGVNIFFKAYLQPDYNNKDNSIKSKCYYRLFDSIKRELPERLFKNITFIDSEQRTKVLNKIPVFELYQNYLEGQYVTFGGKYYCIDKIDYDNGVVELTYCTNNENVRYRQCRNIRVLNNYCQDKELPVLKVNDCILRKKLICADIEVNTDGYYEFNKSISFAPGSFGYKEVNSKAKGLCRNYKSTSILAINIISPEIRMMDANQRFNLSFTLSVLLNELFETLFSNIKQYILVRPVIHDEKIIKNYENSELVKMYQPIIDKKIGDGINIYITEDTEIEKGIIDAIKNNFDSEILKILYDYLFWLTKEKDGKFGSWHITENGDFVSIEQLDKLDFLKYGKPFVDNCLDLNAAFKCLDQLILKGNKNLTDQRTKFTMKRIEKKTAFKDVKTVEERKESRKVESEKKAESTEETEPVKKPKNEAKPKAENESDDKTKHEVKKESVPKKAPKPERKSKSGNSSKPAKTPEANKGGSADSETETSPLIIH